MERKISLLNMLSLAEKKISPNVHQRKGTEKSKSSFKKGFF
jgi:hypothetical protein